MGRHGRAAFPGRRGLEAIEFGIEWREIGLHLLQLVTEFFPVDRRKGDFLNSLRNLDDEALALPLQPPGDVDVAFWRVLDLLVDRGDLLVRTGHTGEFLLGVGTLLRAQRFSIVNVGNVDDGFQVDIAPLDPVVESHDLRQYQRRTRDGPEHLHLAAFHAAGQIDFALARK